MLRSTVAVLALALALPTLAAFPDCENGPEELVNNLVCDTDASPPDRATALIKALKIEEKLENLVDISKGASRIGLPAYRWWNEALHGIAYSPGVSFARSGEFSYATSFANPILIAAAFDDALVKTVAEAVSTEARAFSNAGRGGLDYWTPNVNGFKDPRWGRGMETPGEDMLRIKGYTKAVLAGLEGPKDPYTKIIATCKHYATYDLERWNGVARQSYNALVNIQDLSEYYLPPFQQCARDSKVGSIMCAYNAMNGVPACANTYLMHTILREHWNWTGQHEYVVSDCNGVKNIYADHKYVSTAAKAAALAITAGTDNVCEATARSTDPIGAYNSSGLTEAVIDRALRRQYEGLIRAGYFDPADDNPYRSIGWSAVNTEATQKLARQSAAESMVLLKNDGTLPYSFRKNSTVALIGMWANETRQVLGGYSGTPPYSHTPVWAAQQLGLNVVYATGPKEQNTTEGSWTANALAAAQKADVVLYFGGIDGGIEAEDKDRYYINWSPSQLALIESICALGKPCIVSKLGGGQLDDTPLLKNANVSAILWAGYPGQDGGRAVFDVLTGAVAPAGRLPVTQYPGEYVNQIPMTDMTLRPSNSSPGRTYRFYDKAVLPFGHGLHYTNFSVSFNTDSSKNAITADQSYDISKIVADCSEKYLDLCPFPAPISASIKNTGGKTSDFVTLAFLTGTFGPAPHPLKTLVAYARTKAIAAGEAKMVELPLQLGSLARVDIKGNTVLYPGNYTILLDEPTQVQMSFTLVGEERVLDQFPQFPDDYADLSKVNNTNPW